ncbi:MAG: PilZ domain-containing protein [Desulfobacterales bacterium]|nr:PilZ domain-containing protein [Deltaproteobacteria bacterium]NNK93866.1 PilZ domain-containing protein [Desulfobacterales bacterium]
MKSQQAFPTGKEKVASKSFVRADAKAVITCMACNKVDQISVENLPLRKINLKVKCSCSHLYKVTLDYRQSFRKSTNLMGAYTIHQPGIFERIAVIRNISLGGICLEVEDGHKIRSGQQGFIDFILDDKKKTRIRKEFSVRTVAGKNIGCKFKNSALYEKELGFYLLYNH